MKNTLTKLLPRIIPIVALIMLLTACFLAKPHAPHKPTTDIPDDDVPLACLVDAYYYVAHPDVSLDDLSSLTEDMFDFVGEGSVFFEHDIYDDIDAVNEAINSSPDINGLVGDGQTIEWRYIVQNEDTIIVAGSYADIDIEEEASENDPIEVEYYLYNPRFFKATITSVSPAIAQYIGDGLYYYTDDLHDDPDTVWSQVAEEPEYTAPSGKYIEWGSAFLYRGKYVVIGRYVEGEKPNLPGLIAENADWNSIEDTASIIEESTILSDEVVDDGNVFEDFETSVQSDEVVDDGIIFEDLETSDSHSPTWHAVGDGVTDDTAALNEALTQAAGGSLHIPAGTYLVTETLQIPANTTITGDGDSTIIIACDGFAIGDDLLRLNYSDGVSISNITISGNESINTRARGYSDQDGIHLLDIWNSSNISITNCRFIDNVYCAVRIVGNSSNFAFSGCKFINVDCGVICLGSGNVSNLSVEHCLFDGHKNSESISLFGSGHYSDIFINDNTIKNKLKGHAIYGAKGPITNIQITNNKLFDDCVGINLKNASPVIIDNNELNFGNTIGENNGKGISLIDCTNVTITNNTITKTCQQGLYLNGCSDTVIHDNTISDCGYVNNNFHSVDIRGTCINLSIYSNTISRSDNTLSPYSFVAHCNGNVELNNNRFENSKILLEKDSSNVNVFGNNTTINNLGVGNKTQ